MSQPIIAVQDIYDLKRDIDDAAEIVNGDASTEVPTRYGGTKPSIAKAVADALLSHNVNTGQLPEFITADTVADAAARDDLRADMLIAVVEYDTGMGGGGFWYVVPASSVTPNGVNIVQCTGVPTLALVHRTQNTLDVSEWGANDTNSDAVITALNQYAASAISVIDNTEPSNFGRTQSPLTVILSGVIKYSNTLIVYPGVNYELPNGATLKAAADYQIMVRVATRAEWAAATGENYYGKRQLWFAGGGTIDGDNKASIGFLADTVASMSKFDFTAVRVTKRKYATTGTCAAGTKEITLASVDGVAELDTIMVDNDEEQFYTIKSIDGFVVTVDRDFLTTVTDGSVIHRAVGISHHMTQQADVNTEAHDCDIGEFYGTNRDGYACTDLHCTGMAWLNQVGVVCASISGSDFISKTIHKNFNGDLITCATRGLILMRTYHESLNDNHADTYLQPVYGVPITAATLRTFPMIDLRRRSNFTRFIEIRWPTNAVSTTFRRLIRNRGQSTVVDGVTTQSEDLNENPLVAGEFAPFEQQSNLGQMNITNFRGPSNLADFDYKLVVDETGQPPSNNRSAWSCVYNGRTYDYASNQVTYAVNVGQRNRDFSVIGETYPRTAIGAGGLFFGDSSAIPLRMIRYQRLDGDNLAIDYPVMIQGTYAAIHAGSGDPNGVVVGRLGSIRLTDDGGAGSAAYIKETGALNTGWEKFQTTGVLIYAQNNSLTTVPSNGNIAGVDMLPTRVGSWTNASGGDILPGGYGMWVKL